MSPVPPASALPPAGITIEPVEFTRSNVAEVARVATAAFVDDPFFCFLTPNRGLRQRGLEIFWRGMVESGQGRSDICGARQADGRLVGVAVFIRPGMYPFPVSAQLRQARGALWAMLPRPRALLDGSKYMLAIDQAHPHERQWYLELLAVDPECQRGGIGSALQADVYRRADHEGLASYLETQREDNLVYYRRFGYEMVQKLQPVPKGPPLWTMSRPPRPVEAP